MAYELLECRELLTMSMLSNTAIGGWIHIEDGQIALVAVADWILPKDAFVMLWFWYLLDSKIYMKEMSHKKWDPIIRSLNRKKILNHPKLNTRTNRFLEKIFEDLYHCYNCHNWSLSDKNMVFQQVITGLQEK